jgi:hypothetical protein
MPAPRPDSCQLPVRSMDGDGRGDRGASAPAPTAYKSPEDCMASGRRPPRVLPVDGAALSSRMPASGAKW